MTAVDANPRDTLPQDRDAEMAVLGAMLTARSAIEEVTTILAGADFYLPAHEVIFGVIADMYGRGEPADPKTVHGELFRLGELRSIPGPAYLFDLLNACTTHQNASYYARTVRQRAVLRRITLAGTRIQQLGTAPDGGDADTILAEARTALDGIGGVGRTSTGIRIGDAVADWLEDLDNPESKVEGWDWPWIDLNDVLLPARRGQMVVFGARPKIGKSTALVDCVRHLAIKRGVPSLFFSLEMPRQEVIDRIMAAEAEVSLTSIRNRTLTWEQREKLWAAYERFIESPLTLFNEEATIGDLRAAIRSHGAQMVGYDYLQLAPVGPTRDASHKGALIGQFAQGLKQLALSEDVLVLTAAQLNRGPEQRADKRPQMADFRESGAIEQALDVAVMLHRPEFYNATERAGECDLIVDGQRNGPKGERTVASQLHMARFSNMAGGYR